MAAKTTPGNWYAFRGYYGGKAINLDSIYHAEADLYHFHGYATRAEAEANPNNVNLLEKLQVNAWVDNAQASGSESTGGASATEVPGLGTAVNTAETTGQFLGMLSNQHTWIRVAKVVVGGSLLLIGLAHMTGADNAVASAARKVPLPI